MKRTIRVKLDYRITIDDEGEGAPLMTNNISELIIDGIRPFVPVDSFIEPGAKLEIGLTRESMNAARAKRKAQSKTKAAAR